jgi:hypothetical protein
MMHYWQEVLKVRERPLMTKMAKKHGMSHVINGRSLMGITGANPSSRIKDSQIRGRIPSIYEYHVNTRIAKNSSNHNCNVTKLPVMVQNER